MNKVIRIFAIGIFSVWASLASAEIQFGVGAMYGQVETDGTETEGTAADTSNRTKSIKESFIGADLFLEYVSDNEFALGIKYIPFDIELGKGSRTDVDGSDPAENDNGVRTASADLTDFYTLYTNIPIGGGWYGLLGYHQATIETTETLNNSSYGNVDVDGYEIGIGQRLDGRFKYELSYTDFDDVSLTATGGGTNTINASADAMTFRISYGF